MKVLTLFACISLTSGNSEARIRHSELLEYSNSLTKKHMLRDNFGESWLEQYIEPMLMKIYGLKGSWDDVLKSAFDMMEHTSDVTYCRIVEEMIMPYAAAPLAMAGAQGILKPKVAFPTYNTEQGETGVFNMNQPMVKDGQPNYLSVDQIGSVKDTGKIKIAIVGDWGAGTEESMVMTDYLQNMDEDIHFSFHLGDVYFSGLESEIKQVMLNTGNCESGNRKLSKWFPGTRGTFALNGNHEMMSRGEGYFNTLLPAYGQKASYGMFQSEYWNFFLLDSAYNCLPEVTGIASAIDYFKHVSGDVLAPLPQSIQDWLEDPKLKLFDSNATQSIVLAQHMQLLQPFADHDFDTANMENASTFELLSKSTGTTLKYLQTLLKKFDYGNEYSPVGFWGHDHKSMAMETKIPAVDDSQVNLTLIGQLMGQGGFMVDSPNNQPIRYKEFGMKWYDSEIYKTVKTGMKASVPIGFNGFNIVTIEGKNMTIEYFRATPNEKVKAKLVSVRVLESQGKTLGAKEIHSWVGPDIQTDFNHAPTIAPTIFPPSSNSVAISISSFLIVLSCLSSFGF